MRHARPYSTDGVVEQKKKNSRQPCVIRILHIMMLFGWAKKWKKEYANMETNEHLPLVHGIWSVYVYKLNILHYEDGKHMGYLSQCGSPMTSHQPCFIPVYCACRLSSVMLRIFYRDNRKAQPSYLFPLTQHPCAPKLLQRMRIFINIILRSGLKEIFCLHTFRSWPFYLRLNGRER